MDSKSLQNYAKDQIGAIITVILVSVMILNNNILNTIPFIIIVSFAMYWIGVRAWTIYIWAMLMCIILPIASDSTWLVMFVLPITFIQISGGFLLGHSIHKMIIRRNTRNIILVICSLTIVYLGLYLHSDTFGDPFKYVRAKEGIQTYINDTHDGKLIIEKINFSWKMNHYNAHVRSAEDSRDTGLITYGRAGYISDDYHYRIKEKQALQAKQVIVSMIKQRTDIPVTDISSLDTSVELPHNKYRPRDMYLGEEPLYVRITLEPDRVADRAAYKETYGKLPEHKSYESKEAFGKEAYQIIQVLKEISYPYEEIKIESFLPDGNSTYNVTITGKIRIDSLNDLLDIVYVDNSRK